MEENINWKLYIGEVLKDEKRDITINDRLFISKTKNDRKKKHYIYSCNKCGYKDGIMNEYSLFKGNGCVCCAGKVVVEGINDLATLRPDLVKYFKHKEIAKSVTIGTHKEVELLCPECGVDKKLKVYTLVGYGFSCSKCGDGISKPEKFAIGLLKYLEINYITQLTKKHLGWCGKYKYDFYFKLNNEEYIIEVHGEQHFLESTKNSNRGKLKDIQKNDELKRELAISNGIKSENYIIVDCRYSEPNWMKCNFIKSLGCIIELKSVDWECVYGFIDMNLSIAIRDRWNNRQKDEFLMASDMNREFGITRSHEYLNFWTSIGKCDYNPKESLKHIAMRNGKLKYKKINIYKDGILLGTFESITELSRQSMELFGVKLYDSNISRVAKIGKLYKGYTFKYS